MSNIYGRQVVLPLTNKSGGGVIAGDVVIIDTGNDSAFTTTTTGAYQGSVGIAQETIANNATGRVLVHGEAALVNVNASVTRGHYVKTYTAVKQATGSSTRVAGVFGQFTTGGTTPKAWLWGFPDNAGASGETVATSAIWTTAGKVAVATGAGAAAEKYPPGYEYDYVEFTSSVNITATTEGTANTVVTSSSVTYDGTPVWIEVWAPFATPDHGGATSILVGVLRDDTAGASIGKAPVISNGSLSNDHYSQPSLRRRLTPSAGARVYSFRAYVSNAAGGQVAAGAGGSGNYMPGYIRITKA